MEAAYALYAEEQARNNPLRTLLDISEQLMPSPSRNAAPAKPSPAKKQEIAASNEASMNILTAAMSGVKRGGPRLGKPRR